MSSRDLRRIATPATPAITAIVALLALTTAGCRQDMHDQPKLKPYRSSEFFANGSGFREIPAHTVARGTLREDAALFTGKLADGSPVAELPVAMTKALLLRGQERYNIFCSPCHGRLGDGRGMVVQRGYKQPTSYHDERLRQAPVGYFFDVMSNGFGVMSSYAPQVPVADRWAIAAYIRALQLSQHVDASSLSAEERARLDQPAHAPNASAEAAAHH